MEKLELLAKGCLETCWYGKYHYMEPWAGCGHDCPYCYARFRSPVTGKLSELGAKFHDPAPLFPEKELLERIRLTAGSGEINILKLCRYTDIFTPKFVKNGLALKILQVLAASKVKRVIITTKGLPDRALIDFISGNAEKFSYNAAMRPANEIVFEKELAPLEDRISAAAEIAKAGTLTTIHLDPFVAGFDDREDCLGKLLAGLRARGLRRAMFSYLLLNQDMLDNIRANIGDKLAAAIKADYDISGSKQYLRNQEETQYWALKTEVKKKSVEKTAMMLGAAGFEFVLCGLKNIPGLDTARFKGVTLCDGKFYA